MSVMDTVRYGSDVAAIKSRLSSKQWKQIVKLAKQKGWTIGGAVSGDSPAMKERTQAALRKQAQSTVNAAFAPSEKQGNTDLARVQAWDDKRKADNASYEEWLSTQRAAQDAKLSAATANLTAAHQTAQAGVADMWKNAPGEAQANLGKQTGTVSDFSQANALNVAPEAQRAAAQTDSAVQSGKDSAKGAIDLQGVLNNAALGMASAREGQRQADTTQSRQKIMDSQSQLAVKKATSVLNEFTRLTGQQLSVSQAKADNAMLAEKLNIQQGTLNLGKSKAKETARNNKRLASDRATDNSRSNSKLSLDQQKEANRQTAKDLNADGKVDGKDYKLKVKLDAKAKALGKSLTPDSKNSNKTWEHAVTAMHMLQDWHAGKKPPKGRSMRSELRQKYGASDLLIDVAEDLRKHNGRLSARGVAKAKQLGIPDPTNMLA